MAHSISGASLQGIYDRLNGAPRYHPLEADTFADWSIEAGDIITVTRDGKSYQSPAQSTVMRWKRGQQVSISAGGNEKREPVAKVSQHKYGHGGSALSNNAYYNWHVEDLYNQMCAGLEITAQGLYAHANALYAGMYAELQFTASGLTTTFLDLYHGMESTFQVTASAMTAAFNNYYLGMQSEFQVTASAMTAAFNNYYLGMQSEFQVTASAMTAAFNNYYLGMQSSFQVTASAMTAAFNNYYTGMQSSFQLTASALTVAFNNYYTGMQSALEQTESNFHIYVSSYEAVASIVAEINDSGSGLYLSADHIQLAGQTTISDVFSVSEQGFITFTGEFYEVGTFHPSSISLAQGGGISFLVGTAPPVTYTLNDSNVPNLLTALQVVDNGNNGYKMQGKTVGNSSNWTDIPNTDFSRAITSLNGVWSNGILTVTAQPQNQEFTAADVIIDGTTSISSDGNYTYKVKYKDGSSYFETGESLTVAVTAGASAPITVDNWSRTQFSASNSQYNNGRTLSIPVSVDVNGTPYSNTFTTAAIKLAASDYSGYMKIMCGNTCLGNFLVP